MIIDSKIFSLPPASTQWSHGGVTPNVADGTVPENAYQPAAIGPAPTTLFRAEADPLEPSTPAVSLAALQRSQGVLPAGLTDSDVARLMPDASPSDVRTMRQGLEAAFLKDPTAAANFRSWAGGGSPALTLSIDKEGRSSTFGGDGQPGISWYPGEGPDVLALALRQVGTFKPTFRSVERAMPGASPDQVTDMQAVLARAFRSDPEAAANYRSWTASNGTDLKIHVVRNEPSSTWGGLGEPHIGWNPIDGDAVLNRAFRSVGSYKPTYDTVKGMVTNGSAEDAGLVHWGLEEICRTDAVAAGNLRSWTSGGGSLKVTVDRTQPSSTSGAGGDRAIHWNPSEGFDTLLHAIRLVGPYAQPQ